MGDTLDRVNIRFDEATILVPTLGSTYDDDQYVNAPILINLN